METMRRILVGISGASGAPIAIRLLQRLKEMSDVETHLVMTRGAKLTIEQETEATVDQVKKLADVVYENEEIGSRPASGSFSIDAMIIVPCSMELPADIVTICFCAQQMLSSRKRVPYFLLPENHRLARFI